MTDGKPRVLILSGKTADGSPISQLLSTCCHVEVCKDSDQAFEMLRKGQYDAVFADVGDFLPLERALVDRKASVVLNTIGEGVCVVDDRERCVWANDKLRTFPSELYERVKQTCISARAMFNAQITAGGGAETAKPRSKKFGFQVGDDKYFEAYVSPVLDESGGVKQVVAVVWDASTGRRLQQKIDAIDAAGRELVRLDSEAIAKLHVAQRLDLLEKKIIRYTRDLMHFDHFCIRLIDRKTNKLELVISEGLPKDALEVDLYAEPEGNGISGYVASTGRSYICHDVEKDIRYVPGLDHAKSSLTVPLRLYDQVIGIFNIESQTPGSFHEDDRQFAEIFGRYIAFALNVLDLLVVERYTATDRIVANLVTEVTGPLDEIVGTTQSLVDDYIGHDDMRRRLNRVLDSVEKIKRSLEQVTAGPSTILGAHEVKAGEQHVLNGKRVLVADDDPEIREQLYKLLSQFGCDVIVAKDGREAVNIIDHQDLDLVISDIRMPHRNGYDIFAFARRKDAMLPVILMTGFGYDPEHQIVRANQEGLQGVLLKPFQVALLMETIHDAFVPKKGDAATAPKRESAE